jgi:hypothetical protein
MTPVLFTIYDLNTQGIQNVDVFVNRFYTPTLALPNSWYYDVGIYKTSIDGTVIIPMTTGLYTYDIYYQNKYIKSSSELFIPLSTNTRTFTIDTSQYDSLSLIQLSEIMSEIYYNKTTNSFVYNWNDSNSLITGTCLRIIKVGESNGSNYTQTCVSGIYGNNSVYLNTTNVSAWYVGNLYSIYKGKYYPLGSAEGTKGAILDNDSATNFLFIYIVTSLGLFFLILPLDWRIAMVIAFGIYPYVLTRLNLLLLPITLANWVMIIVVFVGWIIWSSGREVRQS